MSNSFTGKGTPIAKPDVRDALRKLRVDEPFLWSLVAVETKEFGFLSDRRPQILFERHVFHKRTLGRFSATNPEISDPKRGGYVGGAGEYDRLARAMQLDESAALESASWGLGQVMGFNWKAAGFTNVRTFVAAMVAGENAHLEALVNFILANSALFDSIKKHNWARIAFYYNGASYKDGHYDDRLEQHYRVFLDKDSLPNLDVRTVQTCLLYLGYLHKGVDGIVGPSTRAALQTFCKPRHLPPDIRSTGELDAETLAELKSAAAI